MELAEGLKFVGQRHQGVVCAIKSDGRPQLSNIVYVVGPDGDLWISITDSRAKAKNLQRDPRASLYVVGDTFWQYVVIEASARMTAITTDAHDAVADELVELYSLVSGEHPDWEEYRQAMVDERRLVLHLTPERAYGMIAG